VEEIGQETLLQQLRKIMEHIERHENVLDLGQVCRRRAGTPLDAFAYTYSGKFFALAGISRDKYGGGIRISKESLEHAPDEIVLSKALLIEPGAVENALVEKGRKNGTVVSDMCVIASRVSEFTINLACSLKYFSDMGGDWDDKDKEWTVVPHSGNYHFFEGEGEAWFDAFLFINGIRGTTIMGTPLFLIYGNDPSLAI
jgi:hypothetical protein